MTLTALILTAGKSRRMGCPKARLVLDGRSLLATLIANARTVANRLVIVVGSEHDARLVTRDEALHVQAAFASSIPTQVVVGCPEGHPIDSLRMGLRAVATGDDLLLWPIDYPFATNALLRTMVMAHQEAAQRITEPAVCGKGCHPTLVGRAILSEFFAPLADAGAKAVIRADPKRVTQIVAADTRLLAEINTPEQAAALGIRLPSSQAQAP